MSRIIILTAGGHKPISALHPLDTAEFAEPARADSGGVGCSALQCTHGARNLRRIAFPSALSLHLCLPTNHPIHPSNHPLLPRPCRPTFPFPRHFASLSLSLPSSVVAIGTIIGNGGESIIPLRSSSQSIRRDQSQARSRPTDIPSRPRRGPLESAAAMAGLLRPTTELGKKRSFVTINGRKDKRGQKIKVARFPVRSLFLTE